METDKENWGTVDFYFLCVKHARNASQGLTKCHGEWFQKWRAEFGGRLRLPDSHMSTNCSLRPSQLQYYT
jgi:hypothetical protein